MSDKIHYFHKHEGNRGGFTVAFVEESPNSFAFNYARCSEQDNFSRKIGRMAAAGRLNSAKVANYYFLGSKESFLQKLSTLKDYQLSQYYPIIHLADVNSNF